MQCVLFTPYPLISHFSFSNPLCIDWAIELSIKSTYRTTWGAKVSRRCWWNLPFFRLSAINTLLVHQFIHEKYQDCQDMNYHKGDKAFYIFTLNTYINLFHSFLWSCINPLSVKIKARLTISSEVIIKNLEEREGVPSEKGKKIASCKRFTN